MYGEPESVPVDESTPFQDAESPYGWTKQACERVLTDHATTHPDHRVAVASGTSTLLAHIRARALVNGPWASPTTWCRF